jgi:anti-sigma factor RsiW
MGMPGLACLWMRSRLDSFVDGALAGRAVRRVEAHVGDCPECRGRVQQARRLRALLRAAVPEPVAPDFSSFWAGVERRIGREPAKPVRDPWWFPLWRPVWGHPRLALSGALAVLLALTLSLWPADDGAWADVVVQDVSTPDPEHTVMVYSSPDRSLTVIWVFSSDGTPVSESVSR